MLITDSLMKNTQTDCHYIPQIYDFLDSLASACHFINIDLSNAYHKVQMKPGHEFKTALISQFGLFEYVIMPFRLWNAPATFQKRMHKVYSNGLEKFAMAHLDDILIFSEGLESHIKYRCWDL